jgi:hypothetical protein
MATFKRFLVCADNHGELIHRESVAKLLAFAETWKPHYRIHLGDLWDFSPLRGGASAEEKACGISEDYAAGIEFLDQFRPSYLTLGNHDDRIWQIGRDNANGVLREHCAELVDASEKEFKRRKIQWIPYKVGKFLRLPEGGPKLIHGFRSSIVSPAKLHFTDWGEVIHGHVHKPDSHTGTHADGGKAFSVGCIGDIDRMTYADRYSAKMGWRQGFLFGLINTRTGSWEAWHATKEGEHWISPHGVL